MATYVNDLRLKEIATGDEAGTWGTSTNTNLELIAEAFSFGTEAITTNANTHTTTIADGSTDPGRSIFLKYTGALDSDCTITIGPNTVSKLWLIENATTDSGSSGPYNIIIKQGTGATVTIPNSHTKAIYSDGAGAGGAMVEAFTDLNLTDTVTISGSTPTLTIGDAGAEDTKIVFDGNAQDFYIGLDDSADDLVIGKGSAVGTTPAIEIDENLDIKFAESIGVGQAASSTTGDIVAQTMSLKGTTPTLTIGDGGEEDTKIVFDGNAQDFYIGLDDSADDLVIGKGSAVGTTPAIVIDENLKVGINEDAPTETLSVGLTAGSLSGIGLTLNDVNVAGFLTSSATGEVRFGGINANYFPTFYSNNSEVARFTTAGRLGLGTTNPESQLEIVTTSSDVGTLILRNTAGASAFTGIAFSTNVTAGREKAAIYFQETHGTAHFIGALVFATNSSSGGATRVSTSDERMRIDAAGNLGWSTTSDVADSGAGTKGVFFSQSRYSFAGGTSTNTDGLVEFNKTNSIATNNNVFVFNLDGSFQGDIDFNGGVVRYNTTSDYRRKENVTPLENATNQLKQLKTYNFNFIDNPDFTHQGFLAHEAQEVVPNAVSGSKDAVNDDGKPIYQTMDNSVLVPLLVKTIQELEERITTLEGA